MRCCIARRRGKLRSRCALCAADLGRGVPKCPKMSHLERKLFAIRPLAAYGGGSGGQHESVSPTRERGNLPRSRVGLTQFGSCVSPVAASRVAEQRDYFSTCSAGSARCREMSRLKRSYSRSRLLRTGVCDVREVARNGTVAKKLFATAPGARDPPRFPLSRACMAHCISR